MMEKEIKIIKVGNFVSKVTDFILMKQKKGIKSDLMLIINL